MNLKENRIITVLAILLVMLFACMPALAGEGQSQMFRNMVHTMKAEGLGEEVALRLAENNRFMAQMCLDTLEQDQLKTRAQDKTGEDLEVRMGSAFGMALATSYRNQGEEKTFQAAMTVFSSIRRGLSPEGAASSVQILAENDYEVDQMYRVMMRLTEQLRKSENCTEECLMDQLRVMARERLSVRTMEQKISDTVTQTRTRSSQDGTDTGQTQNGNNAGNNGQSGTSEGGSNGSGGNGSGQGGSSESGGSQGNGGSSGNGNSSGSGGSDN